MRRHVGATNIYRITINKKYPASNQCAKAQATEKCRDKEERGG